MAVGDERCRTDGAWKGNGAVPECAGALSRMLAVGAVSVSGGVGAADRGRMKAV